MASFKKTALFLSAFVFLLVSNASFAEDATPTVVISRGVGTSTDGALKDAFAQAVQQVVGVLMSAETMIENDQVIKDNILTYSDGFIKKYEVLRPASPIQGGLIEITIKATVEQKELTRKLGEAKVLRNEVKGMENVWAQMVTKEIRKEEAEQILINALEQLKPMDYLIPEVVDYEGRTGSQAELMVQPQQDGETVKVSIGVAIKFDHAKYVKEVQPYLKEVLDKTCSSKMEGIYGNADSSRNADSSLYFGLVLDETNKILEFVIMSRTMSRGEDYYGNKVKKPYGRMGASSRDSYLRDQIKDSRDSICIVYNTSKRYNPNSQEFSIYSFPRTTTLKEYLDRRDDPCLNCTLLLKDAEGNTIQQIEKSFGNSKARFSRVEFIGPRGLNSHPLFHQEYTRFYISPEFFLNTRGNGGRPITNAWTGGFITMEINKEDLKDVKSFEVKLEAP